MTEEVGSSQVIGLYLTTGILQTSDLDHCAIKVRIDCMAHLNYT